MDDNKGLGEGMTSVDIYCHRQYKGQWQQEADEQGLSSVPHKASSASCF